MKTAIGRWAAGALALAGATVSMPAAAADLGIGLNGGTLGAGVDFAYGVSSNFVARAGFNTLTLSEDFTEGDIDYSADLELDNVHALADWHVFGGGFRLTGGVIFNDNAFDGDADVEVGDEIGGQAAGSSGNLALDVTYDEAAPYLGIGWGNRVRGFSKVSFAVDAGVMFQGTPDVDLTNNGIAGIDQDDLDAEADDIEDELENFELYPVISASLIFRF